MAIRTVDNALDTGRKWPTSALAPKVMTEEEGVVCERIVGPAASATVALGKPGFAVRHVQSFVTATGAFSVKPNLTEGVDFSVNLANSALSGKASLKELLGTDYSAATWVVWYSTKAAEGTIGGQSDV